MTEHEPVPLVTMRRAVVASAVFILTLITVWFGWIFVSGERTLTECSFRNDKSSQTTTDFTFLPPGEDCVFLDDRGREVGRVRAR